ncbi:MAG: hypothetical protein K6A30_03080 [Lachnospiraceae bacterium]|nr:hypothetical protein [Lachnospiraceae bacterium]
MKNKKHRLVLYTELPVFTLCLPYFGGFTNTVFLIFHFAVAAYYQSRWFYIIGLYNLCIAVIRAYLSRKEALLQVYEREGKLISFLEGKITTRVAAMMIVMNTVISMMGLLIVYKEETFQYHFIILYALAIYVFVKLGMIIVALIQKKPHHNGIWKTVQLMNLEIATVSVFTFQTALLNNYEPNLAVRSKYNLMTSCIVFGVNLVITFWLFWRGRKLRKEGNA